jgi:hypothetical protein
MYLVYKDQNMSTEAYLKKNEDLTLCLIWHSIYNWHISDRYDNWCANDSDFVRVSRHLLLGKTLIYKHFFLVPDHIHIVHHHHEKADFYNE